MARRYPSLTPDLMEFIAAQPVFFVATATAQSRINLSPKGLDSLRVLDPNRIAWMNLTGSGNETAAHVRRASRMTIMFCSFGKEPLILRLYGAATAVHHGDAAWAQQVGLFGALPDDVRTGARQIFDMRIDLVQTSCGFGVPYCESMQPRSRLADWIRSKGVSGIRRYWREKNRFSIDGEETGIPDGEP